jgi:hypothetical protein
VLGDQLFGQVIVEIGEVHGINEAPPGRLPVMLPAAEKSATEKATPEKYLAARLFTIPPNFPVCVRGITSNPRAGQKVIAKVSNLNRFFGQCQDI